MMNRDYDIQIVIDAILSLRLQLTNFTENDGCFADCLLVHLFVRQIRHGDGILELGVIQEKGF